MRVRESLCELEQKDVAFVSSGPLSVTWQKGDRPEDWGDLFNPDMCCTVEDITMENISFNGEKIVEKEKLIKEIRQEINSDYPNTVPAGGTGWGKFNKVDVK